MKEEKWLPIYGWDGYLISSYGRVKSIDRLILSRGIYQKRKGKYLFMSICHRGYYYVTLCSKGKNKAIKVHRLVALAFILNPENKPQVNHKDGNKLNNHVDNLEWNTNSENIKHAYKNNLFPKGHKANAKLTPIQVLSIRKEYIPGVISQKEIAKKYGLKKGAVQSIICGRTWGDLPSDITTSS